MPIGPDNRIEPGGPDFGQPTHFLTGRQWGMFAITVPKDFGTKKLTWTIDANGHKTTVHVLAEPAVLDRLLQERRERQRAAAHQVRADRARVHRPAAREVPWQTLNATVGQPLDLTAWAADQPPTITFESRRGRRAAAAAAGAAPSAQAAANEPLPAFIGGRVIAGTPAAPGGGGARPQRRASRAATSRCCGRSIAGRAT